jgi:NADH:ubiquinone reductase (non-electrogenic)
MIFRFLNYGSRFFRNKFSGGIRKLATKSSKSSRRIGAVIICGVLVLAGATGYYYLNGNFVVRADLEERNKPKLVVLGTGWGAIALLKELKEDYDVTVVSPRNYFLFTPLLPAVTVGSLETRSVVEPIRKYCKRKGKLHKIKYYEAECTAVDVAKKTITCEDVSKVKAIVPKFTLPYDYLVVAVGSVPNTFNIPGVTEYTRFLKSIEDAREIRSQVMDCFESANYPDLTDEERRKLLSFVVVGGGPTGVEFAAELHDFFQEDLAKYFPKLMPLASITLIQSSDHILNTYDKKISEYTEQQFRREAINVKINSRVHEVKPNEIVIRDTKTNEESRIPFGICVWSTGITQAPLVKQICSQIPRQLHEKALVTDYKLKVKGTDSIYAIGDCATIEQEKLQAHILELFHRADTNNDGVISDKEFEALFNKIVDTYPQLLFYSNKVKKMFQEADVNGDGVLSFDEFHAILKKADNQLKSLPSTAQVANQQGRYLGKAFNLMAHNQKVPNFEYHHFGHFAYIGGKRSVADLPSVKLGGFSTWWLWRGVYIFNQQSFRNRYLVLHDWMKTWVFGRDISRF